jgi:hypothetical protein
MRTQPMVHVYCRDRDQWVVFQTGRFAERVVHPSCERAIEFGRWLSQTAGVPLRVHADGHQPFEIAS